jgi:hypothetical protein
LALFKLTELFTFERRVLDPIIKLQGFHVSGPATHHNTLNKENGDGQGRRFITYMVGTGSCGKKALQPSSTIIRWLKI